MLSEEEKKAIEWFKKDLMFWLIEGKDYVIIDNGEIPKMKSLLNLIEKQQKEIEEKTTILLAGAEKVKQLEKGNRSLMESRIKWKNRYYKEKAKNKECISKDKIREKIKAFQDVKKEIIKNENKLSRASITYDIVRNDYCEKMLNQLLEEN